MANELAEGVEVDVPGPALKGPADCENCMATSVERLTGIFEASAHRWEVIVYPALIAFVILAGYGFYLIYSLTRDVQTVAANMNAISNNMKVVTVHMQAVSDNMHEIRGTIDRQANSMDDVVTHMSQMNHTMRLMTGSVDLMRRDIGSMNYNVSKPMNFMNNFVPW
ncbi:hypothetical protein BOW53_06580 [Solemya pervernicosa gill symbiont]|uniref:DUF948 domain-containing protein n=2 Tax=Gammaproteobacteria incertae sedis TaxID=118884 RepID=A0A1T2L6P2_9GAMM|nr:hypothetical protein [Candidatus Reidiella endopervernicosa]OOZ40778.1 hypothetical protein BOW53_06580 [Solemya pervernicosa gill symbiont]QKQ26386.1 hypothetical protein HUE57_08905 [Candidatus Reidiella endopervernicosa]